jgi:hypothetical protein
MSSEPVRRLRLRVRVYLLLEVEPDPRKANWKRGRREAMEEQIMATFSST